MPHPRVVAYRAHDRPRAELIERLRRATCPATMLEALRRDWPYPEQRGMRLAECRIDRVHPVDETGFVIEFEMRLEGKDGEKIERVFGDLDMDGRAEHRSKQILESLRKRRRGQLSRKEFTNLVAALPDPELVLRFAGLDERIDGLKLRYDPEFAMPLLSRYVAAENEVRTLGAEVLGHRL